MEIIIIYIISFDRIKFFFALDLDLNLATLLGCGGREEGGSVVDDGLVMLAHIFSVYVFPRGWAAPPDFDIQICTTACL